MLASNNQLRFSLVAVLRDANGMEKDQGRKPKDESRKTMDNGVRTRIKVYGLKTMDNGQDF